LGTDMPKNSIWPRFTRFRHGVVGKRFVVFSMFEPEISRRNPPGNVW
jgi:hypothetical protein